MALRYTRARVRQTGAWVDIYSCDTVVELPEVNVVNGAFGIVTGVGPDPVYYARLAGVWVEQQASSGGGTWGSITGTIANQTDLQTELDGLQTDIDTRALQSDFADHNTRHESGGADPIRLDDLAAPEDNTDLNATTSLHGLAPKATAPASGLLSVLGIENGETVRSDKPLFDTTNPAALGTAAPGSQLVAARRDHVHALPAIDALGAASDNTTLNVSTGAHGLCPKLPNDATKYLDGTGAYTTPAAPTNVPITRRTVLTDAQIKTLNSVPVEVVPAPASGIIVRVLKCSTIKQSTAGVYSGAINFSLRYNGIATDLFTATSIALASADKRMQYMPDIGALSFTSPPFATSIVAFGSADRTGGNAANYLVVEVT